MASSLDVVLVFGIFCLSGGFAINSLENEIWKSVKGDEAGPKFLPGDNNLINVSLSMSLISLSDYDERTGTIQVIFWPKYAWKVPGVSWDPTKFKGISQIQVPKDELWLPDIVPYKQAGFAHNFDSRVVLQSTGDILWVPSLKSSFPCRHIKDWPLYPRDRKVCSLKFGSWTYSGDKVNLSLSSNKVEKYFDNELGNWKVIDVDQRFQVTYYECCPEPYPNVKVWITIERDDKYYGISTVVPGIIIGVIISASFFMSPSSPARILTQMLALITLVYISLNRLPHFNKTGPIAPAAKYLLFAMLLDLISIIWSVLAAAMWIWTADNGGKNGCKDSLLSKFECVCCLPAKNSGQSKDTKMDEVDLNQKRSNGLSSTQRLCLVLDRIFGVVDLVLFVIMFCCTLF